MGIEAFDAFLHPLSCDFANLTISINEGADRNLDRHPLNVKISWNNLFLALLQCIFQISYL